MFGWITKPYRIIWNVLLDAAFGPEEPFEYQYSTTPDPLSDCPRCGDPPEYVRCYDPTCPTSARATGPLPGEEAPRGWSAGMRAGGGYYDGRD